MSAWNLAQLPDEERKQVELDKAVAAVAYLERMGKPVVPEMEMRQFPQSLWPVFQSRLAHYSKISDTLPRGTDPVYRKDEKNDTGQ
ncbi:TPA: DNA polymerase III subunit theta [Escherichia coli]|nr:DNA polymerase III subunit theta [Escherichia coli]HAV9253321.1 DNA polymerase III subunit theta [Escherichia coli]HAW0316546.1 DNA polymerase III subunit theta [Escherichia coli]HAW1122937.1 DNA polymerase III subunit theta [Escherichia coli]HCH7642691.1 DNA polymerase III subunit theta [Escherichia coli]